jgi:hypothetical protein
LKLKEPKKKGSSKESHNTAVKRNPTRGEVQRTEHKRKEDSKNIEKQKLEEPEKTSGSKSPKTRETHKSNVDGSLQEPPKRAPRASQKWALGPPAKKRKGLQNRKRSKASGAQKKKRISKSPT